MCFLNHPLLLLRNVIILKTCLLDRNYIVGETRIQVVGVVFVVMVNGDKFINIYVLLIHFNLVLREKHIRSNVVYLLECHVCCMMVVL